MQAIDAVLKREYGISVPAGLNEEEWLRLYAEYRWLRNTELQEIEIAMHNAVAKVINRMFANNNETDTDTIDTTTVRGH